MKPTTQAKTASQLCNQIVAMEEILTSVFAGAKEIGMLNARGSFNGAMNLKDSLEETRIALHHAHWASSLKAGAEAKVKQDARNEKYAYLREEYRARKSDNPHLKARAILAGQAGRDELRRANELKAYNKQQADLARAQIEKEKALIEARRIRFEVDVSSLPVMDQVDYMPQEYELDDVPY